MPEILSHRLRGDGTPGPHWDYNPGCPFYRAPGSAHGAEVVMVSDWRSCLAVLHRLRDLSAIGPEHAIGGVSLQHAGGMFSARPDDHAAMRARLNLTWGPAAVEKFREDFRRLARRYARRLRACTADLVPSLIVPYVRAVISLTTGLGTDGAAELSWHSGRTTGALLRCPRDHDTVKAAWEDGLYPFTGKAMAAGPAPLMAATIKAIAGLGLAAHDPVTTIYNGFPTMEPALTRITAVMLEHPGVLDACWRERALVPLAVREALRGWAHFTFGLPGLLTADTMLGGRLVRAGTAVVPNFHGAEMDPGHTRHPGAFDMHRPKRAILAWGAGPHACLGRHVAVMAAEELVRALADLRPALSPRARHIWLEGTMPVPAELPAAV